jgi:hypothetical protein
MLLINLAIEYHTNKSGTRGKSEGNLKPEGILEVLLLIFRRARMQCGGKSGTLSKKKAQREVCA